MRSFLIATGVLVLAAHVQAQSATTATDTTATAPPLIKSVADDPNDSPMVRAAKRAVASRQNAGQRRVVTLASPGAATRGRVAIATGPAIGPNLPPPQPDASAKASAPKVITAQEKASAQRQAEVQEKLKQLKNEEERIAAELDEEHPEMDEDLIDKRLAEIEAERKKLLQPPPPGI